MLEEPGHECFVFGKSNNAIANVARRKHVELFAQTAAGTTVVAHRHYSRQFANDRLTSEGFCGGHDITLQALEQGGKTGAPADCDYTQVEPGLDTVRGVHSQLREHTASISLAASTRSLLLPGARLLQHPDPDRAVR